MKPPDTTEALERAAVHALARAADQDHWFFGHFGAGILAGAGLLRSEALPEAGHAALQAQLGRLIAPLPDWFDAPMKHEADEPVDTEALVAALEEHIATPRNSGHGTIYTVAALRALRAHPQLATAPAIDAIHRLHALAQEPDPARYLGYADYTEAAIALEADGKGEALASCDTVEAAVRQAFVELRTVTPDREIDGRRYFLAGEKIHLVTHAHALWCLEQMGYTALAQEGLRALRLQILLTRYPESAQQELPPPTPLSPSDAAFWEAGSHDPWHQVKLAEAVVALLPLLDAEEHHAALDALGTTWALLGVSAGDRQPHPGERVASG